ncbi:sigma-54 interaction domain-containing protein [Alicyclobacillus acidocaldarius]|uniref:PAS modulated sigma54 specific transcriptional regulator, Fis family n=1 Tax=Alicyclobacillus acidocaldarius subsp. acidocaldarius (strain ATCC 27009 / DSM 446 / BCRC 14685 / JCM 5260 / KCTC 1825 / NBRC 15652 / NCIMB 11725 / NRRL B-14509 / 104-IA) TaxID=521098 RepID=C8WRG8_ALIAD|nr:sigma 54-interacting transcriptional regulator [Alicyclobacillus acidocaldarius]ACV57373.1 PAS modulated sigma54 specific transcriptional regulator, Fis family [Alicyclobacillus acidocaldarius subsp. acidocaldarius DSM 446]
MEPSVVADVWKLYQEILEFAPVGVHAVDREGRTRVYNRVMGEIDGYRPDEVLEKNVFELYELDEETSTLWRALKTGHPVQIDEQVYVARNGRRVVTQNRTKPVVIAGEIIGAMEIAVPREAGGAQEAADARIRRRYSFADILGESRAMQRALDLAERAARMDLPVLLVGETGTGKELFAQAIHGASARKHGPFLAQNCAAWPEGLAESVLFGTRRGGFTGAVDRAGVFELACGGTLLLDEVHAMSPSVQAKLLRALQDGEVWPIGARRSVQTDVRVIAAMNVPPSAALSRGLVRPDLLYRIGAIAIHLPPLRERPEDIPLLAQAFLRRYGEARAVRLSSDAMAFLTSHDWPGNVRELEQTVRSALALWPEAREITSEMLRSAHPLLGEGAPRELERVARAARPSDDAIRRAYEAASGNLTHAAQALGISRQRMQYHVRRLGLRTSSQPK